MVVREDGFGRVGVEGFEARRENPKKSRNPRTTENQRIRGFRLKFRVAAGEEECGPKIF